MSHNEPKPIVITKRFHSHRREQVSGESVTEYVAELKCLATHCQFGNYLDKALDSYVAFVIRESRIDFYPKQS